MGQHARLGSQSFLMQLDTPILWLIMQNAACMSAAIRSLGTHFLSFAPFLIPFLLLSLPSACALSLPPLPRPLPLFPSYIETLKPDRAACDTRSLRHTQLTLPSLPVFPTLLPKP